MSTTPISIYTDGSYKDNKGGYSFVFDGTSELNLPKIVFGVSSDSTSITVELTAIIRALQYLETIGFKDHPLKIRCDVLDICKRLKRKIYNKWDNNNWQTASGNPITSDIEHWFKLSTLIKEYGENNILIEKAPKRGMHNIAHKYSRIGSKLDIAKENTLYILYSNLNPNELNIDQCETIDISSFTNGIITTKPWEALDPVQSEGRYKKPWFDKDNFTVEMITLNKIILTDDIHLNAKEISFNGLLNKLNSSGEIKQPIAVRPIENGYYSLVTGISIFSAAKILGKFDYIPCVITDLTHEEFFNKINTSDSTKP